MIRFGMNKKSNDPINDELPFYYIFNNNYIPMNNMFVTDYSRSFYRPKEVGYKKIVWMETRGVVLPLKNVHLTNITYTIHIDKDIVIAEEECPCSINGIKCNEFEVLGPSALIYNKESKPSVYIIAMGEVNIIG